MKLRILKIISYTLTATVMMCLVFIVLKKNNAFQLRVVKIYDNHYVTKEEIARLVHFDFSKDIFEIDLDTIANQLRQHPMVEKVAVSRQLPSAIKIKIKEYNIIAGVAGSEVVAASDNGQLIFEFQPEVIYDLPVITGIHFKNDSTGKRIPKNPELLKYGINLLKGIRKVDPYLYSEISELNFNQSNETVIYLRKNSVPIILGRGDLNRKLNYFATIYYHLKQRRKLDSIMAIDVRFNGQVVVKEKS